MPVVRTMLGNWDRATRSASQRLHGGAEDARHRRGPRRDERGHGLRGDGRDHEVLVWGADRVRGSTGIHVDADDEWAKEMYMEPQFVTELQGKKLRSSSVSHGAVCTSGGDVFVWGHNLAGQLGLTDFQKRPLPTSWAYFETDDDIRNGDGGENHCRLFDDGRGGLFLGPRG